MNYPKIKLKPGRERSVQNFHPWIFSGAVQFQDKEIREGDVVEIFSSTDNFLATAHFHHGSIVARILSFGKTEIDSRFFFRKFQKALELRKSLRFVSNPATTAFRLINAEGDGLPGLIIDIYNQSAVVQAHTAGMFNSISEIKTALQDLSELSILAVYDKRADGISKQESTITSSRYLSGEKGNDIISENNLKFKVNWEEGQKTGFFLDQRDNRKLLMNYCPGKKILNAFSYSGGFSVYALKAGGELVHSVDSSKKALRWCEENVSMNFENANHSFFEADVFDFLKSSNENYDVIVLDPPAFAKHLDAVDKATAGYRNLNYEAIRKINNNGIIFTFSCSQAIDKNLFRKIIFMAAAQAKRNVKILHQLSQAPDHPVNIYHPESEYLKGLVLYVDD